MQCGLSFGDASFDMILIDALTPMQVLVKAVGMSSLRKGSMNHLRRSISHLTS